MHRGAGGCAAVRPHGERRQRLQLRRGLLRRLVAFAAGLGGGNPAGFLGTPGQTVNIQFWGRDTAAHGSYLSEGLEYTVCP